MPRNLQKEAEWERKRYKRYQYRCPRDLADQLDKKLAQNEVSFSEWLKAIIEEYVKWERS